MECLDKLKIKETRGGKEEEEEEAMLLGSKCVGAQRRNPIRYNKEAEYLSTAIPSSSWRCDDVGGRIKNAINTMSKRDHKIM